MQDFIVCAVCGAERKRISIAHAQMHGFNSIKEYQEAYPESEITCEKTCKKIRQNKGIKISNPIESVYTKNELAVPSHQTKKRITYEEFKNLLNSGLSLTEMIKQGCSKHQIHFFSIFAQGKIKLTKEQFMAEYEKIPLDDIAKKHGIQRDHLTQLREHYGIKRKGKGPVERRKREKPLTERQKRIIYGCLMGDGYKMGMKVFKSKQSVKQREYLDWKYKELEEHISPNSYQITESFDTRSKKINKTIGFYTWASNYIEPVIYQFYKTGSKIITQEILDNLDELSLAIWFMDDGTTDWNYRNRIKGWNMSPDSSFCTDCFSFEEDILMQKWFFDKWKLNCIIKKRNKNKDQWRLKFRMENCLKLHNIIRPHIVPSMMYKIDYEAYLEYRKNEKELQRIENDKFHYPEDDDQDNPSLFHKERIIKLTWKEKK